MGLEAMHAVKIHTVLQLMIDDLRTLQAFGIVVFEVKVHKGETLMRVYHFET